MRSQLNLLKKENISLAEIRWPRELQNRDIEALGFLSETYGFSVARGDVLRLDGNWYVTHAALLRLARRTRCRGIRVQLVRDSCDPGQCRWVFKATVYRSGRCKGFVGYGDADPSNVSSLVRGAELRVAETRAVNRALRKAYGVGLCSIEELGSLTGTHGSSGAPVQPNGSQGSNGSSNAHPRLRDQLCLLIRQFNLDPTLVKAYAADFCGTEALKEASRDLVESFISHLAASAKNDRDALICKLNSYAQSVEVQP